MSWVMKSRCWSIGASAGEPMGGGGVCRGLGGGGGVLSGFAGGGGDVGGGGGAGSDFAAGG